MNELLMIPVEKIVRPMFASVDRKLQMREELYLHLEEIFQEELQNGDDEETALQASLMRLGEPAAIRTELQGTVSKREQLACKYDQLFLRKRGESRLQYAARCSKFTGLWTAIFLLVSFSMGYAITLKESVLLIIPFLFLLTLTLSWNAFLSVYVAQYYVEPSGVQQNRGGLIFAGVLFGVSIVLSQQLLWTTIPGWYETLDLPPGEPWFAFFAGAIMFVLIVWLVMLEKRRSLPWEMLELAD